MKFNISNIKSLSTLRQPGPLISSDGELMRTSFKVRFELTRHEIFHRERKLQYKFEKAVKVLNKIKGTNWKKTRAKMKEEFEKVYKPKESFVEFPIHIMYD